jgi:hypothetical protein
VGVSLDLLVFFGLEDFGGGGANAHMKIMFCSAVDIGKCQFSGFESGMSVVQADRELRWASTSV